MRLGKSTGGSLGRRSSCLLDGLGGGGDGFKELRLSAAAVGAAAAEALPPGTLLSNDAIMAASSASVWCFCALRRSLLVSEAPVRILEVLEEEAEWPARFFRN